MTKTTAVSPYKMRWYRTHKLQTNVSSSYKSICIFLPYFSIIEIEPLGHETLKSYPTPTTTVHTLRIL